ncbi:MAG: 50S ribosomal protein L3 [Sandaracinaceae bacterium]|jgi:large subunit ribosomal protein L3|nr:50S ribosomal protein L3 [Sandaracinaceae bacterium]
MNTHPGLIGKKLGNTQIFEDDGNVRRVTVIEVGPVTVLGKRTAEKDGYSALIVGMGEKREKLVNKAEGGFFKKTGQKPARVVRELRLAADEVAKYEVGAVVKPSDVFATGQLVDVSGQTKGRGFTGVMTRWNFRGSGTKTHGTHEYQRHGGAIGTNMTPGRTLPNLKMPGQYGDEKVTIQNLRIARVLDDKFMLLVEGSVPGHRNAVVTVRGAIKRGGGKR